MATTRVDGTFRLVYLVFNAIGLRITQDQQVAGFANAAAHLEPGGCFLREVGVPDLRRLPPGEDAHVFAHAPAGISALTTSSVQLPSWPSTETPKPLTISGGQLGAASTVRTFRRGNAR